jgi:peptidoglycan/xylan/chitin deacetylase (PgdA/CDA1 family)
MESAELRGQKFNYLVNRIKKKFHNLLFRYESLFFGAITKVKTQASIAALTFDDGPHPTYTPKLLDILDKYHAKGTFFITGERAKQFPSLVKRMYESGHCIGNHSWSHLSFPLLSSSDRRLQLKKCKVALGKLDSGLFRPPFGHHNWKTSIDISLSGYKTIAWSVQSEDWLGHNAGFIFENLYNNISPGSIVLLHDNLVMSENPEYLKRLSTIRAVEKLLHQMKHYKFVTVEKLIQLGTPIYRPCKLQPDREWLYSLNRCT